MPFPPEFLVSSHASADAARQTRLCPWGDISPKGCPASLGEPRGARYSVSASVRVGEVGQGRHPRHRDRDAVAA